MKFATKYIVGDLVEFKVGGFAIIKGVSLSGATSESYATTFADHLPTHPDTKTAWFRNSEIRRLAEPSATRTFLSRYTLWTTKQQNEFVKPNRKSRPNFGRCTRKQG